MKWKTGVLVALISAVSVSALWSLLRNRGKADEGGTEVKLTLEQADTLRGLQGVGVAVDDLQPGLEAYGITTGKLQADVETLLRQHGIKVMSREESYGIPGRSCLSVQVGAVDMTEPDSPAVAVKIDALLAQEVQLVRDSSLMCLGITWHESNLESFNPDDLGLVSDRVEDIVGMFVSDYLAANPEAAEVKGANDTVKQ
jgi:hypothetical protein